MWQFAQYSSSSSSSGSINGAVIIIYLLIIAVCFAAAWKIYAKAGEPGWKAIIPFYNTYILLKIVGLPSWYLILYFIPLVNLVVLVITTHRLSKSFGYGVGMTILQFLAVGELILGFGKAKYLGPGGKGAVGNAPTQPTTAGPQSPAPTPPAAPAPPPVVQ